MFVCLPVCLLGLFVPRYVLINSDMARFVYLFGWLYDCLFLFASPSSDQQRDDEVCLSVCLPPCLFVYVCLATFLLTVR